MKTKCYYTRAVTRVIRTLKHSNTNAADHRRIIQKKTRKAKLKDKKEYTNNMIMTIIYIKLSSCMKCCVIKQTEMLLLRAMPTRPFYFQEQKLHYYLVATQLEMTLVMEEPLLETVGLNLGQGSLEEVMTSLAEVMTSLAEMMHLL
ncbi:hypothetical protein OIU79_010688 [Salix purpurea]|uniref:Uncharacterized protein n=1 Tax=Salix purpurea TaxID=77065 RepID=A0A9Q0TA36_SALPP|nr:hypothetical protein OIU79_010688 [Salix purpurea]